MSGSATPGNVSLTEVAAGNGGYRLDFGGAPIRTKDLNGDGRDDQLMLNFNYPSSFLSGIVYGKGSGVPVSRRPDWRDGRLCRGQRILRVDAGDGPGRGRGHADGIPDFLVSTAGPATSG